VTVIRQYVMIAHEGAVEELAAALADLDTAVAALPGCGGTELLQDVERPERFVFSETWDSPEAHKASAPGLSKAVIGAALGLLAEPPHGAYLVVPGTR
jgi:quinol monooxygenase YgiN